MKIGEIELECDLFSLSRSVRGKRGGGGRTCECQFGEDEEVEVVKVGGGGEEGVCAKDVLWEIS